MFHYLDKYAHDDALVKVVFDHFRNLGIIAVIFGAAVWKQKNVMLDLNGLWNVASGAVLAFTAFGLIWLNHAHLHIKLRALGAPRWIEIFFSLFYVLAFGELFRYLGRGGT